MTALRSRSSDTYRFITFAHSYTPTVRESLSLADTSTSSRALPVHWARSVGFWMTTSSKVMMKTVKAVKIFLNGGSGSNNRAGGAQTVGRSESGAAVTLRRRGSSSYTLQLVRPNESAAR